MRFFHLFWLIDYKSINLFNLLFIPFAVAHIRYIQWKYKSISKKHNHNRSNSSIARLILLKAYERYYKSQFDSWGKYHHRFWYSDKEKLVHKKNMEWLFPKKDFMEWDMVVKDKFDSCIETITKDPKVAIGDNVSICGVSETGKLLIEKSKEGRDSLGVITNKNGEHCVVVPKW